MDNQKFFSIIVGRKEPETAMQGQLSKQTGMPVGKTQKVRMPVGAYMIPNFSRVWAKRIPAKGTSKKEGRISVSDTAYAGELKFLPYGDAEGESVEIRYLPNSGSLDKLYQDTVQKIKPLDDDAFIILQQGINNFDKVTQPSLVAMLEVHSLNQNSKSRDQTMTDYDYINYDPAARNKSKIQEISIRTAANNYVLEARENKGMTRILASIFNIEEKLQDDVIIETLLERSEGHPEMFVNAVDQFQKQVYLLLEESLEASLIAIEPDGVMYNVDNGKKDELLEGIEGKKVADQIGYLVNNILKSAEIFDAIVALRKQYTQYQKQIA